MTLGSTWNVSRIVSKRLTWSKLGLLEVIKCLEEVKLLNSLGIYWLSSGCFLEELAGNWITLLLVDIILQESEVLLEIISVLYPLLDSQLCLSASGQWWKPM